MKKYTSIVIIFSILFFVFISAILFENPSAFSIKERDNLTVLDSSSLGQDNTSYDSSNNSITEKTYNECNICNRDFVGAGYTEVSNGVWRPLNDGNQSFICSPECGRKFTQNFNAAARKYGVELDGRETNSTNNGDYSRGNDGRIYEKDACTLCKGTGIETGRNVATGVMEGRTCPMCDGRGVRSY